MKVLVTKGQKINIRSGPGINYLDIGDPIGDTVAGDIILSSLVQTDGTGSNWYKIERLIRLGVDLILPSTNCWVWGGGVVEVNLDVPQDITVEITLGDGVTYAKSTIVSKLKAL